MKTIACLGSGSGASGEPCYDAMVEVGRLLAERGLIVATGGFGGAGMEAPAKGATTAGGKAIGYTMYGMSGNPYLSETVDCREQYTKSTVGPSRTATPSEVQFGVRLGNLLVADGFIIAAEGGPGTMVELMAIIVLNHKLWKKEPKHLAILKVKGVEGKGWGSNMLDRLEEWGVLPREVRESILIVETPEEAVAWAIG